MFIEYTNEEKNKLAEIDIYYAKKLDILDQIIKTAEPGSAESESAIEKHTDLIMERIGDFSAFYRECELQRFNIIKEDVKEIIEDAKRQVLLLIKNTYEEIKNNYENGFQHASNSSLIIIENNKILLDANSLERNIKNNLDLHFDALEPLPDKIQELNNFIIKAIKESPYTTDFEEIKNKNIFNNNYFPVYHGAATDKLTNVTSKGAETNILGDATFTGSDDLKVISKNFKKITAHLNVNTHKLLSVGIALFTESNAYYRGNRNIKASNYRVSFPLEWYALACGKDILEKPTTNHEEEKREAKRAAELKKKFKREIKKQGELLRSLNLSWNETVRGKNNFFETDILSAFGVIDNQICMTFAPDWADYLIKLPLTQYDIALLSIDPRQDNAYRIGLKLTEHYSMDNNQRRGTADKLKVKTMLQVTTLPNLEKLEESKEARKWKQRIKKPLEDALNVLLNNVISSWGYLDNFNNSITKKEVEKIKSYSEYEELKIIFTLKNPPDHAERLERRAIEKEEKAKLLEEKNNSKNT